MSKAIDKITGTLKDEYETAMHALARVVINAGSREVRILELEEALWLLAGDVEARHRSCTCAPPTTDKERDNLAMAKHLVKDLRKS